MKNSTLLLALLAQAAQAFDQVFPMLDKALQTEKRVTILQQRAQAQQGIPRTIPPHNTLFGTLAWLSAFPPELQERVLDLQLGQSLKTYLSQTVPGRPRKVTLGALSPDGKLIAMALVGNNQPCMRNLSTGAHAQILAINHLGAYPNALLFDKTASLLAIAHEDNFVSVRDAKTGRGWTAGGGSVVQFNQNGTQFLHPCTGPDHFHVRNPHSGEEQFTINPRAGPIKALALQQNPTNPALENVITSHDNTLLIMYRLENIRIPLPPIKNEADANGEISLVLQKHEHSLSVSPLSRFCALRRGPEIRMYDTKTWELLYILSRQHDVASKLFFDEKDGTFTYAQGTKLVERKTQTGELVRERTVTDTPIQHADFTPDLSKGFFCDTDGNARLIYPRAHDTLQLYFSNPRRPLNQQLLVWLIATYRDFITHDTTVQANRMKKLGITNSADLPPITALLMDDIVSCFQNRFPTLTLQDLEAARHAMPEDVQGALAQYFGLYVRKNNH